MATNKENVKDQTPTTGEQKAATTEEQKEAGEKMVKVRIPRTSKGQEDVFVSVNMKTYLIKRGVEVEVPESVAEVLRHQEEALEAIMEFEDSVKH